MQTLVTHLDGENKLRYMHDNNNVYLSNIINIFLNEFTF